MNKTEKRTQSILFFMGIIPICSTEQVAYFFHETQYPKKRASELLVELERKKMVEGRKRSIGESKIWRLSRLGKKQFGIQTRCIPLTVRNVEHVLKLGDIYLKLYETGHLSYFQPELREEFINRFEEKRVYCPDAFFIYQNKPYFLEVQRSYLSRMNWKRKWKVSNDFYQEKHWVHSSVSEFINENSFPEIMVITNQEENIVHHGTKLELIILKDINCFIN